MAWQLSTTPTKADEPLGSLSEWEVCPEGKDWSTERSTTVSN